MKDLFNEDLYLENINLIMIKRKPSSAKKFTHKLTAKAIKRWRNFGFLPTTHNNLTLNA